MLNSPVLVIFDNSDQSKPLFSEISTSTSPSFPKLASPFTAPVK